MSVYQRSETYYHWITFRDRDNAVYDPTTVTITITNSCGVEKVSAAAMTQDSTGVYYYPYNIPIDAIYGKWNIKVTASDVGENSIFTDKIYLFPWDINTEVREISGIGEQKSISDDVLNTIIWNAYNEVKQLVFKHHYDEKVRCNCNSENCKCNTTTCAVFDGTNTTFWTQAGYLADYDDDGTVEGWNDTDCQGDAFMEWKDCDGDCHEGYMEILDDICGKIKLTSDGTTAIPTDYAWVRLEYWTRTRGWTRDLMHEAIEYLAAHKVLLRFGELERATSADLVDAQNVKYVNPERMLKEYNRVIRKIKDPEVSGVY